MTDIQQEPDYAVTGTNQGVSPQPGQAPSSDQTTPGQNNTGISVPPENPNIPSGATPASVQTTPVAATTQVAPGQTQPAPPGTTSTPPPVKGVSPNDPNAGHPAVQAAGRINSILNAILPPRVQTKIDVNTGETTKTPVPRSRGDIAMAIALEAISGGLAGLQGKGPNRFGQAAAAGLDQGQQIEAKRKAEDAQQAQEASADYARHAAVLETNLRMWQNAKTVGYQDYEHNQAYVAPHRAFADTLPPGIIKDVVPESKLSDFHVTKDSAIPYSVSPRPDSTQPDGQAKGSHGEPLWDINYAIVDPKFKVQDQIPDDYKKALIEVGTPGLVNGSGEPVKWPSNTELALHQYMNLMAKGSGLIFAKNYFKDMADTINDYGDGRRGGYTFANTKAVDLPNHQYDGLIHQAAIKYGVDENLIKGVIKRESGGVNLTKPGGAGELGLMQLIPDTAKKLGVTDATDPAQNIDGGVRYLSQQLANYKGNAKLALAAYNAGPQNVTDHVPQNGITPGYVNDILASAGIGDQNGVAAPVQGAKSLVKPIDFAEATAKDQNFPQAVAAMMKYVGSKKDINADWDNFRVKDPDNYGRIINAMGGSDVPRQFAEAVAQQDQLRKDQDAEVKADTNQKNNLANKQAAAQAVEGILKGPDNFKLPDNVNEMSTQDLGSYLKAHGAGVDKDGNLPDRFEAMVQMARNERSIDAAPQRVWATGSPNELDREQVLTYINKFLNPMATDNSYKNWQEVHDVNKGVGQTIQNAGVAVNHGELLRQALIEMHNGNTHALNRIGNEFGLNIEGKKAPAQFQEIANAYAREVSKVAAGQASPFAAEVAQAHDTLDRDLSETALNGVIDSSNKLMHGRIHTIDQNTYKQTGRHLDNIDDAATAQFQKLGQETPWAWGSLPKGNGAAIPPNIAAQYFAATGRDPVKARQLAQKNGWNLGQPKPAPISVPQQRPQQDPQQPSPFPNQQPAPVVNDNDEADNSPTAGILNSMY